MMCATKGLKNARPQNESPPRRLVPNVPLLIPLAVEGLGIALPLDRKDHQLRNMTGVLVDAQVSAIFNIYLEAVLWPPFVSM